MLHLEILKDGQWKTMGIVRAGGPDGSISHNAPDGRQVYSFGCRGHYSEIRRSVGGVDAEVGPLRAIGSIEFETVATLTNDNPTLAFELRTDRMTQHVPFRFRHAS